MLAVQGSPDGGGSIPGRRVVITGVGVIAPCGTGAEAFWSGLLGPSPIGPRRVEEFDATGLFGPKEIRRVDRFTQFAALAAAEAIDDAGAIDADPDRVGVVIGTGIGGLETFETQMRVLIDKGERRVSPFLVPMMMGNRAAADVSMRHGFRGPCEATVTACAAGTHSIANAARLVATGRCDAAVGGSAEAAMTPLGVAGFTNMTALSSSGISRPFDVRRDGFVIGEGGAAVVLEERDRALARGAHVYAEILGAANTADAYDVVAPAPEGRGAVACMLQALTDAELRPDEITHINAHGTSTPLNDEAEATAVITVFGLPGPALTSIKGITGHSLAASGSLEAVALALTYEHRLIPPTAGLEELDPKVEIDIVRDAPRPWTPGPAMSNSFGFGGHNGTLVFGPA
ncbi:MAG: beta-ketoacyl-[acyl-carrier-protein] synthase family protein [Acidimicrobiaceae bacterium]|nr:beta-ketoacyl-[acyl-carrier-protein] synthase family protein [Acidimicrobiaceae bacterium]MBO0747956.1 beta-ketoacyl-[acyl-carrier-protein] synthase family protein [Acidimicrobiaceae bacterium]